MKNTFKKLVVLSALLVIAALLVFTALRRDPKPAALSRRARARIEALDDAVKNGLISQAEYKRRVAQIRDSDAPRIDSGEQDENEEDNAPSNPSDEGDKDRKDSASPGSAP
ncbi:MAG: hypothetical protein WA823_14330 [Candidatus Acidiferrales bacterium]